MQLELLDLMIREESEAVLMNAELVNLMARVLVVVFHKKGGSVDDRGRVQSQDQAGAPVS